MDNNSIKKLSKETQDLIEKYGYIPMTKAKVRSGRNDSSWFQKTFLRAKQ